MGTGRFWKVCAVWALFLGSIVVIRPMIGASQPRSTSQPVPMPAQGDKVDMPANVQTTSGATIPTLSADTAETLFLVTWTGCAICKRDLPTFGDLLSSAQAAGIAVRMLVTPGTPADNEWFLDRVPEGDVVVFDTMQLALSGLKAMVTPSVVIVSSKGVVDAAFSPSSGKWPLDEATFRRFQSSRP